MIYKGLKYIFSKNYHCFFENKKSTLTICKSNFSPEFEAQIEISSTCEQALFENFFTHGKEFNDICNEMNLDVNNYSSLVTDMIELGILVKENEPYEPSKYIYENDVIAFFPSGPKSYHDKWSGILNDLKKDGIKLAFSPVFHPVFDLAADKFNSLWYKIHIFRGFKSMYFTPSSCFTCYKNRFWSNYPLAKRMYTSESILHVGYEDISIPMNFELKEDAAMQEYDYSNQVFTKVWRIINCNECGRKEKRSVIT